MLAGKQIDRWTDRQMGRWADGLMGLWVYGLKKNQPKYRLDT
jgi:hypothetical protein